LSCLILTINLFFTFSAFLLFNIGYWCHYLLGGLWSKIMTENKIATDNRCLHHHHSQQFINVPRNLSSYNNTYKYIHICMRVNVKTRQHFPFKLLHMSSFFFSLKNCSAAWMFWIACSSKKKGCSKRY